jgi:hypothetical protein
LTNLCYFLFSKDINQDNDKENNNITNQEILTTNEQISTMPQSEAILEKLKKFEPQLQPSQQAKRHAVYVSTKNGSLNEVIDRFFSLS